MSTSYLKSYYRKGSTLLTSEQIETIRTLKGKVPKYRIIRDFHINENRVKDIWGSHERQQQIIQSVISSEILPISAVLSEHSNQISITTPTHTEGKILHLEETKSRVKDSSTTLPNKEIKKRSSKGAASSKSVLCNNELHSRVSDSIPANSSTLVNISGGDMTSEGVKINSEELDASYEQKIKRNKEFKSKLTRAVK
ncbi:hypothetical protein Glove_58g105 [Diversispora epigaea]|uniref:Uncharacterized protein n=1 Tax=Diversispora epigaea TaxID=1348612 RepID=A0A397JL50_9GLOM|nr:hypothetical protein Glove_58g105 [Diversispora epigaea]